MIARPSNPRSSEACDGFEGLSRSEPTSTPVIFPAASRVGTAVAMICWFVMRDVSPSLTNGAPVLIGWRKYERSDTSAMRTGCSRLEETRAMPSRLTHERPPGNSFPFGGWTRLKYASMPSSSVAWTTGACAIDDSVPIWPPK